MSSDKPSSLTPAQMEVLKVLARPMSEEEILALKRHIVRFFADRLSAEAAKVWDERGWTAADTASLRKRHLRTKYK